MNETLDQEERDAAVLARADDPASNARGWLLQVGDATLCTTSAKSDLEGYPFGSVVPYALTRTGHPVVYLARIAAHTANLRRNPRATLFIRQPGIEGDPQKGWRLAVMGSMARLVTGDPCGERDERVATGELEEICARYVAQVPWARTYSETHDFSFWRMSEVAKARYIAGFGKICWLDGAEVLRPGSLEDAEGAITHMNADHRHNMVEMCAGLHGVEPDDAEMCALDAAGFLVRTREPDGLLYFSFGREVVGPELRHAVIDVLQRARKRMAS